MTIIRQFPAHVLRTWRKIATQNEKRHWVHRFTARELLKLDPKSTSQYHAVGPKCKSRWVNGTNRAQKKPKTNRERGGGGHRKDINLMKKDHHTSISRSCFADLKENYDSEWKMALGTSIYRSWIDKMRLKINKPVPRHRPKTQITMGKWNKQGQKEPKTP